jgi:uncharacterized membrane protein YfcA
VTHPAIPLDARLIVALAAIVLAGVAKGVTGMGLPVVGVPVLVALYGDLRLVLPLTVIATVLSDVAMLARWRKEAGAIGVLVPFALAALVGVIAGTHLLTILRPALLSGALACVVIVFVVASSLDKMPTLTRRSAARWGPLIGLIAGTAQGAAGASGPITTGYLLSLELPRGTFLFAINILFVVLDLTQALSLAHIGMIGANDLVPSLVVSAILGLGMCAGFVVQKRIDDRLFRRGVLTLLSLTALGLIVRTIHG